MNKALIIIGIPAFITSFLYLTLGWGFKVSVPVTAVEILLAFGWYSYLSRFDKAQNANPPPPPPSA